MSDSNPHDDPWADLYKDLGLPGGDSTARTPEPPVEPELEAEVMEPVEELALVSAVEDDGEEAEALDDAGADEAESTADGSSEEEPGTRKRRRRRRRRKKKSDTADAVAGDEGEGEAEEDASEALVEVGAEAVDGDGSEFTPELTRDLIANWNVPSWSEIVAGLYRPERG